MDVKKIRDLFPIFKAQGESFVYLDSAATSHRPKSVSDRIYEFYTIGNSSVHRGVYELSEKATQDYEDARDKVAKFINAKEACEVAFVTGTTEAINFVADTWGRDNIKEGDEIVVTQVEHHANLLPWQRLAKQTGAKLRFIKINVEDFFIDDPEDGLINEKTKLVGMVHSSNVLGNMWREGQLKKIIDQAHAVGAKVMLDGAQSVPHEKVDVQELDVDFFAFSGHKVFGPTGIGVLYIKKELHEVVGPYQVGGSMIHDASYEDAHWAEAPAKYEAGTPPIAQVIGLGAAVDFCNEHVNFDEVDKHEAQLAARIIDGLDAIGGIQVIGNKEHIKKQGHLVAFVVDGVHAHDVSAMLGMKGVATRAGHHCVQPFAKLLDIEASARASMCLYNTMEEIDIFIRELDEAVKSFRGG